MPILATASTVAIVFLIVSPVWRSNSFVEQARRVSQSPTTRELDMRRIDILLAQAVDADPLDPTPHADHAQWLLANRNQGQPDGFSMANDALEQAILRDPFYVRYRRLQRKLGLGWYEFDKDNAHLELALDAARASLRLYPEDPDSLIDLGDTLALAAKYMRQAELSNEAITRYEEALDLDNQRAWFERIRRYSDHRRQSIKDRIQALEILAHP